MEPDARAKVHLDIRSQLLDLTTLTEDLTLDSPLWSSLPLCANAGPLTFTKRKKSYWPVSRYSSTDWDRADATDGRDPQEGSK